MEDVKKLSNSDLLDKMAKFRPIAFFGVLAVFAGMAVIITYKLHFAYILVVGIPFIFIARKFYKYHNEIQRRHL